LSNKQLFHPQTTKQPVHIRRNVEAFTDPYVQEEHAPEGSVCARCGSSHSSGRWYPPVKMTQPAAHSGRHELLCPACRRLQDRVPGGVLTIAGSFVWAHKDEILNLIRNESSKALGVNPLERIMTLQSDEGEIEITTTNEKLAQRLGKALHKAYSGTVEYKWSGDTKLARVVWQRND
jgi:hypothetical protein